MQYVSLLSSALRRWQRTIGLDLTCFGGGWCGDQVRLEACSRRGHAGCGLVVEALDRRSSQQHEVTSMAILRKWNVLWSRQGYTSRLRCEEAKPS